MRSIREEKAILQAWREVFRRERPSIDAELAQRHVLSVTEVRRHLTRDDRKQSEEAFLARPDVQHLDPRGHTSTGKIARAFREHAVQRESPILSTKLLPLDIPELVRLRTAARRRPPKEGGEEYVRERTEDRNLELLGFVSERTMPFVEWCEGKLTPGGPGPKGAVPWDELMAEWNKHHSRGYDLSRSMYRAFNRAADPRKRPVAAKYVAGVRSELRFALDTVAPVAMMQARARGAGPEALDDTQTEPLNPEAALVDGPLKERLMELPSLDTWIPDDDLRLIVEALQPSASDCLGGRRISTDGARWHTAEFPTTGAALMVDPCLVRVLGQDRPGLIGKRVIAIALTRDPQVHSALCQAPLRRLAADARAEP
jgi:hypothetical protein